VRGFNLETKGDAKVRARLNTWTSVIDGFDLRNVTEGIERHSSNVKAAVKDTLQRRFTRL